MWQPLAVQLDRADAATRASRVVDKNVVRRRLMAIAQFKSGPARRNARLHPKGAAPQLEAQNRFNRDAVQPTRRTGVPRPPAAPRVRRGAIHVRAHHVRLNFVALHVLSRRGMVDRIR